MAKVLGLEEDERRQKLRPLLYRRWGVYTPLVYGLLGGDPNKLTDDENIALKMDLLALGYLPEARRQFGHALTMFIHRREEIWPEELRPEPYKGIALEPDPDFSDWEAAREANLQRFQTMLGPALP